MLTFSHSLCPTVYSWRGYLLDFDESDRRNTLAPQPSMLAITCEQIRRDSLPLGLTGSDGSRRPIRMRGTQSVGTPHDQRRPSLVRGRSRRWSVSAVCATHLRIPSYSLALKGTVHLLCRRRMRRMEITTKQGRDRNKPVCV